MTANPPELEKPDVDELAAVYLATEELAERLERMRLFKASAYVSMGLDVIREARNGPSASG